MVPGVDRDVNQAGKHLFTALGCEIDVGAACNFNFNFFRGERQFPYADLEQGWHAVKYNIRDGFPHIITQVNVIGYIQAA